MCKGSFLADHGPALGKFCCIDVGTALSSFLTLHVIYCDATPTMLMRMEVQPARDLAIIPNPNCRMRSNSNEQHVLWSFRPHKGVVRVYQVAGVRFWDVTWTPHHDESWLPLIGAAAQWQTRASHQKTVYMCLVMFAQAGCPRLKDSSPPIISCAVHIHSMATNTAIPVGAGGPAGELLARP